MQGGGRLHSQAPARFSVLHLFVSRLKLAQGTFENKHQILFLTGVR